MRKLVILDIDETLLHASQGGIDRVCDFETELYFVYKRPFVDEFLSFCFANFDVAIWTAAGSEFANDIEREMIRVHGEPEFVWSSERCTPRFDPNAFETIPLKNLQKVKRRGYNLDQVIMVDDTPQKLAKNYGNLVRVNEYLGSVDDTELLALIKYLRYLKHVDNVRKVEKRGWHQSFIVSKDGESG